jgi:hypothetical protein
MTSRRNAFVMIVAGAVEGIVADAVGLGLIAIPELLYPEAAELKSTRP